MIDMFFSFPAFVGTTFCVLQPLAVEKYESIGRNVYLQASTIHTKHYYAQKYFSIAPHKLHTGPLIIESMYNRSQGKHAMLSYVSCPGCKRSLHFWNFFFSFIDVSQGKLS